MAQHSQKSELHTISEKAGCFAIIIILLSYRCFVTINFLWLFLTVQWVGQQGVIVVFPDHTHLLFV